jgi:hypothetical protein
MITVTKLSKSLLKAKELDNVIKEQLFIIDDKLLKSNKTWGRNVITHDLPTTFTLIGADRRDIQRLIYSSILKHLEKRGFETKLLLNQDVAILYIAWDCEYKQEDLDNMDSIIKQNMIHPNNIDDFINGYK